MLVLRRKSDQWATVTHAASGDVMHIRVCDIEGGRDGGPGRVNLCFEDAARLFQIERPERRRDEVAGIGVVGNPGVRS